jgi:beta-1,4-mannosyl-glycoprotein beta-1,4-N-acetylglucosaminyltransferase
MTVFDCFMFNNELDLLELRLKVLDGIVDRFVLVEAAQNHRGNSKPLFFADNIDRFAEWRGKIEHIVLDTLPESDDPWVLENAQRNAIADGLPTVRDDDLVLVSDVDEIPRPEVLKALIANPSVAIAGLRMPLFYLRFNYLQIRGADAVYVWGVAARGHVYRQLGPQALRDARVALQRRSWEGSLRDGEMVCQHAGWHFSYLGDDAHVHLKLNSFAHREAKVSVDFEKQGVAGILTGELDLFGRPGYQWGAVRINDYFPYELRQNLDRYQHLLVSEPRIVIDPELSLKRDTLVMRREAGD